MFNFYQAANNPTGLADPVGGAITPIPLSGYVGELFTHVSAPPAETDQALTQYSLVYVKNEYNTQLTNVRVYASDIEHPDQISIGVASGVAQTSSTKTGAPENVDFFSTTNYIDGVNLGTMEANSASGVWIKVQLSGITNDDPYATFRLYAGGQAL